MRQGKFHGKPRTQSQLAIQGNGAAWFLVGASPDLAFQIESTPTLHPRALRDSPIAGVILGSTDLDHVLGLLLLRELQPLRVYGTPSALRILREENSMFGMLNRVDPQVVWDASKAGVPFPLLDAAGKFSGLCCEIVPLGGRYPKYVRSQGLPGSEASAGLMFESDGDSGARKRVAYLPAVAKLDDDLLGKIEGADLLLFDGTFWSDDELIRIQGSGETALDMGHIPVEESLESLKKVKVGRRAYIHINNTNPILDESSRENKLVRLAGWEVAEDHWHLEL